MSKKCGKELHPLYNSWYYARRKNILCAEWKTDFWLFVKDVGNRPENCRLIRKQEKELINRDNFDWVPVALSITTFPDRAAYMRAYRKGNPEVFKNLELKKHFGITLEEYNRMKEAQRDSCAICGKPETTFDSKQQKTRELSVDHCHTTGKIRGLLCAHCNHAIGKFKDNVELLQKAIDYLKENT